MRFFNFLRGSFVLFCFVLFFLGGEMNLMGTY